MKCLYAIKVLLTIFKAFCKSEIKIQNNDELKYVVNEFVGIQGLILLGINALGKDEVLEIINKFGLDDSNNIGSFKLTLIDKIKMRL